MGCQQGSEVRPAAPPTPPAAAAGPPRAAEASAARVAAQQTLLEDDEKGAKSAAAAAVQPLQIFEGAHDHVVNGVRRRLGCKRDAPDGRDLRFSAARHSKVKGAKLPSSVDLRPEEALPIYEQGDLAACTANALAAAFELEQLQEGFRGFSPSRLFIYYNERELSNSTGEDSGSSVRDGIKAVYTKGICDEALWPYEASKVAEQPSPKCYEEGLANRCKRYARVAQSLDELRGCIAAGYGFVFGFTVTCDFMTQEVSDTGRMKLPLLGQPHGGHAVQACGYDDAEECFIVRNSWGADWGDKGHFYMPYKFITNPKMAYDFWAINFVEFKDFPLDDDDPVVEVDNHVLACCCSY